MLAEVYGPGAKVVRMPARGGLRHGRARRSWCWACSGKKSPVSRYRLRSALALRRFDSRRAEELLGWKPRVGVREGIRLYLSTTTTWRLPVAPNRDLVDQLQAAPGTPGR